LEGRPVPVYGDGKQRRAWLYVTDLCDALQLILERGRPGEIYNVAGGAEQENLDTARQVLAGVGRSAELIEFVADRPGHDRRYAMDDAKLRALGWRPRTGFAQGLGETIAWFRAHADWWGPLAARLREDPRHWLNRPPRASTHQPTGFVR
jgi:dTDP-glucose 4,6-dehydratase